MSEGSTGSTRNKTRSNPVRHMKNSVKPGKSDCGSSALMCVCRRGPSPRRRLLSFVQFGNRIRLDFAAPATMAAIESLPTIYNPKQLDHHFTARSLSVSSAHRIPVVFIFFFLGFFFCFIFGSLLFGIHNSALAEGTNGNSVKKPVNTATGITIAIERLEDEFTTLQMVFLWHWTPSLSSSSFFNATVAKKNWESISSSNETRRNSFPMSRKETKREIKKP